MTAGLLASFVTLWCDFIQSRCSNDQDAYRWGMRAASLWGPARGISQVLNKQYCLMRFKWQDPMEHEIGFIVTNEYFFHPLGKNLHRLIGCKVIFAFRKVSPLSCMRSDHPLFVSPNYLIDKNIRPARLRKWLKDAIIKKETNLEAFCQFWHVVTDFFCRDQYFVDFFVGLIKYFLCIPILK